MKNKMSVILVFTLLVNLLTGLGAVSAAGTPFDLASTTPANNATGVSVSTNQLEINYGFDVSAGNGEMIYVKDGKGVTVTEFPPSGDYLSPTPINIPLPPSTDPKGLKPGTTYYVTAKEGAFKNASGDLSAEMNWKFSTVAPDAPKVLSKNPSDGSVLASGTQTLTMNFDQYVKKGTGNIRVYRVSDNTEFATIPVTDSGINNDQYSFDVPNLVAGEGYYVKIDKGAIVNQDGTDFEGFSDGGSWHFSILGGTISKPVTVPGETQNEALTNTIQLSFNKSVTPTTGNISILEAGTEIGPVSVLSPSVTGGGTSKISIKLASSLKSGTAYTVSIPAGAFKDTVGNPTAEIKWSFKTATIPSTQLAISSVSPSNGATGVSVSTSLVATFNRNIQVASGASTFANGVGGVTLRKSGSNALPAATVTVSGNRVTITPTTPLEGGATYYVDIASGALIDSLTNTAYVGLSGASSWSFSTQTLDRTAPVLQKSSMYNNTTIVLQYNEPLNSGVSLLTSSFTVNVNGDNRPLSNAYVSGDSVYVTLSTGIAVGQVVRISYTPSSIRPVEDLAHNAAAAFSSREVTNGVDSVLPKPEEGYVSSSNRVVLRFKNSLKSTSSYASSQFTVTADGTSLGVTSLDQSGSTVTLYLSSPVTNGAAVKVSYTPGAYPLQDYYGQNISAFYDFFVRNYNDTVPPQFVKAEGSGNKVILTYNEALNPSNVPLKSMYSVLVNNVADYVTGIEIKSNQVTLTLASAFSTSQTVTVSYVSGSGGITDLNGNLAGYINLQPINYTVVVDGVRSATVNNDTISLVFNGRLNYTNSALSTRLFYVTVDQTNVALNSAIVNGDTITIKLASPVKTGQKVVLSYMPASTSPLTNSDGKSVAAINQMPVQNVASSTSTTNNGGSAVNLPAGMSQLATSEFGVEGYILSPSSATTAGESSRGGKGVHKYILSNNSLTEAFNYLALSPSVNASNLLFDVPTSEGAAYVGFPVQPLMSAYVRNSSAKIGVRYGDTMYLLPLSGIPFTGLTNSSSGTSTNVWIQLERVSKESLNVTNSLKGATSMPITDPVDLYVSATSTQMAGKTPLAVNGTLHIRTTAAVTPTLSSLRKYDLTTRAVTFMPTQLKRPGGSYTVFSGPTRAGNLLVGPATGYVNYVDIANHWAKSAISELGSKWVMDARSSGLFQPNQKITRSEFAIYIVKGLGLTPDASGVSGLSDISSSSSVAPYIGAAVKANIVTGGTNGKFMPGSYITREQMALMMVRALSAADHPVAMNATPKDMLASFKDYKKIGDKNTVAKAVKEGIINGTTGGYFKPKGTATRAEAAVMLKRVLDKLHYL